MKLETMETKVVAKFQIRGVAVKQNGTETHVNTQYTLILIHASNEDAQFQFPTDEKTYNALEVGDIFRQEVLEN